MAKVKCRVKTGPKLRFEIFKRDSFTCQYCGNTPPAVVLEIDHITPVCKGGETTEENLITACYDCNRGKGPKELSVLPESLESRAERIAESERQLKAYESLLRQRRRRENRTINGAEEFFREAFGHRFKDQFRQSIRRQFIPRLTAQEILEAAEIACYRIKDGNDAAKYFCGICWKTIRNKGQQ